DLPAGLRRRDPRVWVGDRTIRRPAGLDRLARRVPGRLAGLRAVRIGARVDRVPGAARPWRRGDHAGRAGGPGQGRGPAAGGPAGMGGVMSIIGIPLLLGPVAGPVIGGALVSGASWRWIFFVNVPVGAAALALAVRLLPDTPRRPAKLDLPGLALLSGGIAVFLYGLAKIGDGGTVPMAAMAAGLALVAGVCWYALHARQPLLDLRLLRRRRI